MFYLGVAGAMLLLLAALILWGLAVGAQELSPLEALLLPPLALLAAWALAMWLTGLLLAFNGLVALSTLLVLLLAGAWRARRSQPVHRMRERLSVLTLGLKSLDRGEKGAAIFVSLACALSLTQLLAPPSGGDYDSLVYHLAVPWRYVRAGRVLELPYDHHSYFPFAFEMLFAAPLSWFGLSLNSSAPAGGAVAAKVLHWAMLPASALMLVAFGSRVLNSRRAGWMAALIWCSVPLVVGEASMAYIDLGLCAWVLAAFHCAARAVPSRADSKAWILWSGAFAGAALGCKYLGALYAAFVCAWLLLAALKMQPNGSGWKAYASALSLMLVLGGGFYARNIVWTASPVFPFAYSVFGGRGWTSEMASAYTRDQNAFGFGRSPSDLAWLPWRLTMTPLNAAGRQATQSGQPLTVGLPLWPFSDVPASDEVHTGLFETVGAFSNTLLSPLLLALGAPAVLMRRKPPQLKAWMLAVGAMWIFWALTGQYARYLLPALALWSAACGWCAARLLERPLLRLLLSGVLGLWCVVSLGLSALNSTSSWDVVLGRRQPVEWLASTFPGWKAMSWINLHVPENEGVAVWGEPRCLYLDRKYLWADDPHNNLLDYSRLRDWPSLKAALNKLGTSWILWNTNAGRNGGVFGPSAEVARLIEANAHFQFEARGYRVYSLN